MGKSDEMCECDSRLALESDDRLARESDARFERMERVAVLFGEITAATREFLAALAQSDRHRDWAEEGFRSPRSPGRTRRSPGRIRTRRQTLDEAAKTLDRAGNLRFRSKARWILTCIQSDGPDQALYQALMEGLGYSSNRRPFVQLASLAPFHAVTEAARKLQAGDRVSAIGGLAAMSQLLQIVPYYLGAAVTS